MGNINHFNNDPTKDSDPEIVFFTDISDRSSSRFPEKGFAPLETRKKILHDLFTIIMSDENPSPKIVKFKDFSTLSSIKKFLDGEYYNALKKRACAIERGIFREAILSLEKRIRDTSQRCEYISVETQTHSEITSLFNILCQTGCFKYDMDDKIFSFTISGDLK